MTIRQPGPDARWLHRLTGMALLGTLAIVSGCSQSDQVRTSLEHRDSIVAPSYAAQRVMAEDRSIDGMGAPFAHADDAGE